MHATHQDFAQMVIYGTQQIRDMKMWLQEEFNNKMFHLSILDGA